MRAEGYSVLGDLQQGGQAEDLVAAAVGEGGAGPLHEAAHAAGLPDEAEAGAEIQVVGVGEHYLGAEADELLLGECLDAGLSGDRKESGGIEGVPADDDAANSGAGGIRVLEGELEHETTQGWRAV
jgi:hypothetical protein